MWSSAAAGSPAHIGDVNSIGPSGPFTAPNITSSASSADAVSARHPRRTAAASAHGKAIMPAVTFGDGQQRQFQFGDHPEVAATAPEGPEQVRFAGGVRGHDPTVGEHDLGAEQGVDTQAGDTDERAQAAAEDQPGRAD